MKSALINAIFTTEEQKQTRKTRLQIKNHESRVANFFVFFFLFFFFFFNIFFSLFQGKNETASEEKFAEIT